MTNLYTEFGMLSNLLMSKMKTK